MGAIWVIAAPAAKLLAGGGGRSAGAAGVDPRHLGQLAVGEAVAAGDAAAVAAVADGAQAAIDEGHEPAQALDRLLAGLAAAQEVVELDALAIEQGDDLLIDLVALLEQE